MLLLRVLLVCLFVGRIDALGRRHVRSLNSASILSNDEHQLVKQKSIKCDFYAERCKPDSTEPECEQKEEQCYDIPHMQTACYSVWTNDSSKGYKLHLKGCWHAQMDKECGEDSCTAHHSNAGKMFCCCHTQLCNTHFAADIPIIPTAPPLSVNKPIVPPRHSGDNPWQLSVYIFVPILCVVLVVCVVFYMYRRLGLRKFLSKYPHTINVRLDNGSVDSITKEPPSPSLHSNDIVKLDLVKRGRFGEVYQGLYNGQTVAIKVFPPQDSDSWVQEQQIYKTVGMQSHCNILMYMDATHKGIGADQEFWLITSYAHFGSLHDYLKLYTIDVAECLHMVTGMLNGLAFLHAEKINGDHKKPSIVHRDMKSKNVLLKADRTPCIGDFGLAIRCEHGMTPEGVRGQVGTHRYMSPEVLEGATEFSARAFMMIDVYAMAMVIWEVMTRANLPNCPAVEEYKLPFELEAGLKPKAADMRTLVTHARKRPIITPAWLNHNVGSVMSQAMEEMWDQEPEARITAKCAVDRLANVKLNDESVDENVPLIQNTL